MESYERECDTVLAKKNYDTLVKSCILVLLGNNSQCYKTIFIDVFCLLLFFRGGSLSKLVLTWAGAM